MAKNKAPKGDFTRSMLPHNRWEEFFDIIKLRHQYLLAFGGLLFLFALPMIAAYVIRDIYSSSVYSSLAVQEIDQATASDMLRQIAFFGDLILIPLAAAFSIGMAGLGRILLRLSWEDPLFFWQDFKEGIQSCWRSYLVVFLLLSLLYLIDDFVMMSPLPSLIFNALPFGFTAFLLLVPFCYLMGMDQIYKMTFREKLSNAFTVYFKTPSSLLALLFLCLPLLLTFIPSVTWKWIAIAITIIFLGPLILLTYQLEQNYAFDKVINQDYYPEIYDKGIIRMK